LQNEKGIAAKEQQDGGHMDVYVECFVEKEVTKADRIRKTMWIALCVVSGFSALMITVLMVPVFIAILVMTILHNNKLGCLMEYVFTGDEFTVTRVTMNRRKKLYNCKMDRVQSVCHHSEYRTPGQETKNVKDYASGVQNKDLYIMIVNGEKGKEKIYFEPNQELLQAMRRSAPAVVRVLSPYGR